MCPALMRNGLWWVTTPYLCAGFVVKDNKIIQCAPILRKRIDYWKTIAEWVCE